MTTLLGAISGQFTKAFVFGACIPAIVFVLANVLVIWPMLPAEGPLAERLQPLETPWRVGLAVFAATVVAGILYNLNVPLVRLYEGYLFEDTWLGRRMRNRQARKLRKAEIEITHLRTEYDSMLKGLETSSPEAANDPDVQKRLAQVESKLISIWSERRVRFPGSEQFVTPTALGNVIAAFEHYANVQYGMDSVTLWPHLIAVIDARYAAAVDDARTSLDFFINSSFLFAVFAAQYLGVGVYTGASASWAGGVPAGLVGVGSLALLSWLCYRCSIDSAVGWGIHVKAAFDLYRQDLLEKLGYSSIPSLKEQSELWRSISRAMIYGGPDHLPPAYRAAAPAATRVEAEPVEIQWNWRITKGVDALATAEGQRATLGRVQYLIRVENASAQRAESATLVDAPPPGFEYVVGSSHVARNGEESALEADGTSPYRWYLGVVDPGDILTVRYLVLRQPDARSP